MAKLDITGFVNQTSKDFTGKKETDTFKKALEAHRVFINSYIERENQENKKNKIAENTNFMHEILPDSPENIRIFPNSFLRGSLFGVIKKGTRKFEKNSLKSCSKGITVKFTGEKLDQADLDVWAECFCLNKGKLLGEKIEFSPKSFLSKIGRNNGKTDREWLYGCFIRLMGAIVEIGDGRYFYAGQLLQDFTRDEKTGQSSLILNQKLFPFLHEQFWTGLLVEQRISLTGNVLSKKMIC